MKTNRLAAAASTAVVTLGVLVACSPDQSTAPAHARVLSAGFDLLGNANAGQAQVCKNGDAGSFTVVFDAASVSRSFVAGQVGALTATATPGTYTFNLAAGTCIIIYTRPVVAGGSPDPQVSALVTEAAGPTLLSVAVSPPDVGGPTSTTNLATRSARLNFNMFHDAIATFTNEAPLCDFSTFGGFTLERNFNVSYGGNAGRADNGFAYGDLNFVNHTTGEHVHVWNVTGYVHPTTGPLTGAGYEDSRMATGTGESDLQGAVTVEWRFIDKGEPGTKDEVYLKVGNDVWIQQQKVQGGNVQLHDVCKPAPKAEKH